MFKDYYVSANVIHEYGHIVLSKFPCTAEEIIIPTKMGRTALKITL